MGRIRNVKPGYFKHEKFSELHRDGRLFFMGLWTLCDPIGAFEWRPKHMKVELFPWDDDVNGIVIERWLAALEVLGAISRYEVNGKHYGLVRDFREHQCISGKEDEKARRFPQPVQFQTSASTGTEQAEPVPVRLDTGHMTHDTGHMTGASEPDLFDAAPQPPQAESNDALLAIAGRFIKWRFKSAEQTAEAVDDVLRNMRSEHRARFLATGERLAHKNHAKPPVWEVTKAMAAEDREAAQPDPATGEPYTISADQMAAILEIEARVTGGAP